MSWAVWLTGPPAAGKTTVARAFLDAASREGVRAVHLESDALRRILTPTSDLRARGARALLPRGRGPGGAAGLAGVPRRRGRHCASRRAPGLRPLADREVSGGPRRCTRVRAARTRPQGPLPPRPPGRRAAPARRDRALRASAAAGPRRLGDEASRGVGVGTAPPRAGERFSVSPTRRLAGLLPRAFGQHY